MIRSIRYITLLVLLQFVTGISVLYRPEHNFRIRNRERLRKRGTPILRIRHVRELDDRGDDRR